MHWSWYLWRQQFNVIPHLWWLNQILNRIYPPFTNGWIGHCFGHSGHFVILHFDSLDERRTKRKVSAKSSVHKQIKVYIRKFEDNICNYSVALEVRTDDKLTAGQLVDAVVKSLLIHCSMFRLSHIWALIGAHVLLCTHPNNNIINRNLE